jgi:hypothetical protein
MDWRRAAVVELVQRFNISHALGLGMARCPRLYKREKCKLQTRKMHDRKHNVWLEMPKSLGNQPSTVAASSLQG